MNFKLYIFGESSGYKQYPEDSFNFRSYFKNQKPDALLNIKRDADLVYYIYTQRLDKGKNSFWGLCLVFNGVYIRQSHEAFAIFEKAYSDCVIGGKFLKIKENGIIDFIPDDLSNQKQEIDKLVERVNQDLERRGRSFFALLPKTYKVGQGFRTFSSLDDDATIGEAISYYDGIAVSNESNNEGLEYIGQIIQKLHQENNALKTKTESLNNEINKLHNQQRNTLWVSLLSLVVIVMGITIYFKVINPSQVSKYQTEDFIYYGPLKNKKPHGEGVAFYPDDDKYGRRYYIGNFNNGERQDTDAMLYYQNGDYFYGTMNGDKWSNGIFYSNSDASHFNGDFDDNEPYNGIWYRHEMAYKLKNGSRD